MRRTRHVSCAREVTEIVIPVHQREEEHTPKRPFDPPVHKNPITTRRCLLGSTCHIGWGLVERQRNLASPAAKHHQQSPHSLRMPSFRCRYRSTAASTKPEFAQQNGSFDKARMSSAIYRYVATSPKPLCARRALGHTAALHSSLNKSLHIRSALLALLNHLLQELFSFGQYSSAVLLS